MHDDVVDIRTSGLDGNARREPFAGVEIVRSQHVGPGWHAEVELAGSNGAGHVVVVSARFGATPLYEIDAGGSRPLAEPRNAAPHMHRGHFIQREVDLRFPARRQVHRAGGAPYERAGVASVGGYGRGLHQSIRLIQVNAQNILSTRKIGDTVFTEIVCHACTGLLKPRTPVHYARAERADLRTHYGVALIVEHLSPSDRLRDEF